MDLIPLIRYKNQLVDFDDVIPVAEGGIIDEINGKEISHFDGGIKTNTYITTDFKSALKYADTVFLSKGIKNIERAHELIDLVLERGISLLVSEVAIDELKLEGQGYQVMSYTSYDASVSSVRMSDIVKQINVPTIMITGQGPYCNKFDIQLKVRRKFEERGYKVSQIATKEYSPLFGIHALPNHTGSPLWKKVILYNCLFRDVVKNEQPDVLIVGVPGGTMPIDRYNHELYGETAISIAKGLEPDLTVHSTYLMDFSYDYLSNMKEYSRYSEYVLGGVVDYFHVSNVALVFEQDMKTISFLETDSSAVLGEMRGMEKIFNVFDDKSDGIYSMIIEQLQNNIEII